MPARPARTATLVLAIALTGGCTYVEEPADRQSRAAAPSASNGPAPSASSGAPPPASGSPAAADLPALAAWTGAACTAVQDWYDVVEGRVRTFSRSAVALPGTAEGRVARRQLQLDAARAAVADTAAFRERLTRLPGRAQAGEQARRVEEAARAAHDLARLTLADAVAVPPDDVEPAWVRGAELASNLEKAFARLRAEVDRLLAAGGPTARLLRDLPSCADLNDRTT